MRSLLPILVGLELVCASSCGTAGGIPVAPGLPRASSRTLGQLGNTVVGSVGPGVILGRVYAAGPRTGMIGAIASKPQQRAVQAATGTESEAGLDLSPQQQAKLETIARGQQPGKQVEQAWQRVQEVVTASSLDQRLLDQAVHDFQTTLQKFPPLDPIAALVAMRETLTPEQRQKMADALSGAQPSPPTQNESGDSELASMAEQLKLTSGQRELLSAFLRDLNAGMPPPEQVQPALASFWRTGDTSSLEPIKAANNPFPAASFIRLVSALDRKQRQLLFGQGAAPSAS